MALWLRTKERLHFGRHLAWVWPEMDSAAQAAFMTRTATMLGQNLFDQIAAARLVAREDTFCSAQGDDRKFGELGSQLRQLSTLGNGVILLTGHLGCWELLGARVALVLRREGLGPLAVVTGTVHNPPVDRLLQERRRALGLKPMARSEGPRPLVKHLRAGGVSALLLDQKISAGDPVVDFFGRPAPTPDGMVRIALRHGVPILPLGMAWDSQCGRHVIHRLPVLNLVAPGADGNLSFPAQVELLQAECQSALEILIRRNPEQWVWFHERWLATELEQEY